MDRNTHRLVLVLTGLSATAAASAQSTYRDSAKFLADLAGRAVITEGFETAPFGLLIPEGAAFGSKTWSFDTTGPIDGGLVANVYGVIDTQGLFVERDGVEGPSPGDYFYPDESVTVAFPSPVNAAGVFFNVGGANVKGYIYLQTPAGTAYGGDLQSPETIHPPYFFVGIIAEKPFTTATFGCDKNAPSGWNADNLIYAPVCYADATGDEALDLFDFLAFLNQFNSEDVDADCDGNDTLDLFDFLCFVNAFNTGC